MSCVNSNLQGKVPGAAGRRRHRPGGGRARETKFFFVLLIFAKNPLNLNLQMFFVVIRSKILMI